MEDAHHLKIRHLVLRNIGGFENIEVEFSSRFNFVCGPNGAGKSTLLKAIGTAFSSHSSKLRRRALSSQDGYWCLDFDFNGIFNRSEGPTTAFLPKDQNNSAPKFNREWAAALIYLKNQREFTHTPINNVGRDPANNWGNWSHAAIEGVENLDVKRWLVNRFLFSTHPGSLSDIEMQDFEFAKHCFSILDKDILFSSVEATSFDVYVETPDGTIPFEYLSSGYMASFTLLLSIIREVEVRKLSIPARAFDGVILIDELELHLHPAWQREIVSVLRTAFPRAQFVVTTHSPHVVQSAEPHEIIALTKSSDGRAMVREFSPGRFGFKGWTLEEILQDVMGIADTNSNELRQTLRNFDRGLDSENADQILRELSDLEEMLHPASPLRKLLRLQAAQYLEAPSD